MDATPPSMAFEPRQTSRAGRGIAPLRALFARVEAWLEGQREQVALWIPVGLGAGIAAWFALPARSDWLTFCCVALAIGCLGLLLPAGSRLRRMMALGGLLACAGCLLVWGKAVLWGEPPLARPVFTTVTGQVLAVRPVPARALTRVMVRPIDAPDLPHSIRVNIPDADLPQGLGDGAVIAFRVRLMPPAPPAVPGGYDFARHAYFQGIGATGRALRPITVLRPATGAPPLRARLFAHIQTRLAPSEAGIAAALATGDQGAIPEADAEAMRRSGLAHLLSISGLHVTALIGAVMVLMLRVMALSRRAALGWPLMLIAAGGGALAGVGYTLFTGAEVPTIRSCVAALLVLGGLALGRDAITLRLVAAGALLILLFWPEALVGPSFQMSFAAVAALVALGEHPAFRAFAAARDEGVLRKAGRMMAAMLLTGLVIEMVLAPIGLYHFHKAGLLGAFANLIAIPLTTFVVMPLEALALLFDAIGLGAPFWWLTEQALRLLLIVAHGVSANPMAMMLTPSFSQGLFAMMVAGGLWCLLWRGPVRWAGLAPVLIGVFVIATARVPAIVVTGDGRHVAVRTPDGRMAILRNRAGDYVRDVLAESAGHDGVLTALATLSEARCSTDLCAVHLSAGGRRWRLLATRTNMLVERSVFERNCREADIVVSDRRLPRWCKPRWVKIDRAMLARTGGVAIDLERPAIRTVKAPGDAHPWIADPIPFYRSRPTLSAGGRDKSAF